MVNGPATAFAEALRALRTKLLLSRSAAPPQVILVTSSMPGEGKSTVSANLSALLAQSDKSVLLVEADMRNPSFGQRLGSAGAPTISLCELLANAEIAWQTDETQSVSGVNVLQAGPIPPYPAELLGSERMHELLEDWKLHFDYIVLDSPPLLAVTDAEILSHLADMTLLIARPGMTSWKAFETRLSARGPAREEQSGGRAECSRSQVRELRGILRLLWLNLLCEDGGETACIKPFGCWALRSSRCFVYAPSLILRRLC